MTSVPTVSASPLPSRKEVKGVVKMADDGLLIVRLGMVLEWKYVIGLLGCSRDGIES